MRWGRWTGVSTTHAISNWGVRAGHTMRSRSGPRWIAISAAKRSHSTLRWNEAFARTVRSGMARADDEENPWTLMGFAVFLLFMASLIAAMVVFGPEGM